MYRESVNAVQEREEEMPGLVGKILRLFFATAYFVVLPPILTIGIHWLAYAMSADSFYQEPWMAPVLLLGGGFTSGVFIRQRQEACAGGMGIFAIGILALMLFAYLTYQDIHALSGWYSMWLPKPMPYSVLDFIWMLPTAGIAGMLCYHYFLVCPDR